jgi:hypothetical protein
LSCVGRVRCVQGRRRQLIESQARYSKHRRNDVQPIRRDLAELLRPWLKGKERGKPVFKMPTKTAKMMREDLETGREAWLEEAPSEKDHKRREATSFLAYRDAGGRVADFHALRHTYISRLVKSGANIKVTQELARHSTPTLTLGRYSHVQVLDQTKALDGVPSIEEKADEPQRAKATGTDDATADPPDGQPARSAFAARRLPGTSGHAITRQDGETAGLDKAGAQVVESSPLRATCQDLSSVDNAPSRRSSTAEHRFCKPDVGSSILPAGSKQGSRKSKVPSPKPEGAGAKWLRPRAGGQGGEALSRRPVDSGRWACDLGLEGMVRFPSGQRGQTVNLLAPPSVVRIHPSPPTQLRIADCG